MKLKDTKRKYNLFYVDDYVYFDNTVYKIVYSEGYIGYGYDIFKNKPTWEEDIVAINFEDDFEFIDRKRSTLPFNEVFFKGDKTIYFDEYSNRTEVNRFRNDKYSKELAVLHAIAKSKGIDTSHLYLLDLEDNVNKLTKECSKTVKDYYAEAFEKELEKEDKEEANRDYDLLYSKILSELKDYDIEDGEPVSGKVVDKERFAYSKKITDSDPFIKSIIKKMQSSKKTKKK